MVIVFFPSVSQMNYRPSWQSLWGQSWVSSAGWSHWDAGLSSWAFVSSQKSLWCQWLSRSFSSESQSLINARSQRLPGQKNSPLPFLSSVLSRADTKVRTGKSDPNPMGLRDIWWFNFCWAQNVQIRYKRVLFLWDHIVARGEKYFFKFLWSRRGRVLWQKRKT